MFLSTFFAELAFIMCNMGCVKHHSLVLDPNVGTGSMLIAAAAKGAFTLGFDIDIRVVKIGTFFYSSIEKWNWIHNHF